MALDLSSNARTNAIQAVRARVILPFAGECAARGTDALNSPVSRIKNGVIVARNGVILAVEPYADFTRRSGLPEISLQDLGDVVLAPGLVNCHTHLELSHMAGGTTIGQGFSRWVASLVALDRASPPRETIETAMARTMMAMVGQGTALAGDISSRMPQTVMDTAGNAGLGLRLFLEAFGHDPSGLESYRKTARSNESFALAGHAFYSTSVAVMAGAKEWCAANGRPYSLHLAEHTDELECLQDGSGSLCDALRERVLPPSWRPPGKHPVELAAEAGILSPGTMAVHCVHCDDSHARTLAGTGTAVCLCPRSNEMIGVGGRAPVRAFADKGVLLVLGTDSLASNADCDVWNEAEYFLQKNIMPANALLRTATVNGAAVLGCLDRFGTLERSKAFCYRIFPSEMNALLR